MGRSDNEDHWDFDRAYERDLDREPRPRFTRGLAPHPLASHARLQDAAAPVDPERSDSDYLAILRREGLL